VLRRALIAASGSRVLRRIAEDAAVASSVAGRFVAGTTLDQALAATGQLNRAGMSVTLDHLGEAVHDAAVAARNTGAYVAALDAVHHAGLDASVSVKPTAVGLDVDQELCREHVARICTRAAQTGTHVTLDMEGSQHTQGTLDLVLDLRGKGQDNLGCAVQAYLYRTEHDVRVLSGAGASLRLCKGAYAEPSSIAHQSRTDVSASYLRSAEWLLQHGVHPRFATHDHVLIGRIRDLAVRHGVGLDRFELQMLYGVRPPLQRRIVDAGHRLRVYVPYGQEWYPYFVRRLAERPANLTFFLRALVGRRGS